MQFPGVSGLPTGREIEAEDSEDVGKGDMIYKGDMMPKTREMKEPDNPTTTKTGYTHSKYTAHNFHTPIPP